MHGEFFDASSFPLRYVLVEVRETVKCDSRPALGVFSEFVYITSSDLVVRHSCHKHGTSSVTSDPTGAESVGDDRDFHCLPKRFFET